MKYIEEKDNKWHNPKEEMPPTTTDIEYIDLLGNTRKGTIVVEMSGFYLLLEGNGWGSINNIKQWRFI